MFDLAGDAIRVRITDLGARVLSIAVPDRAGRMANVLAGPDSPAAHAAGDAPGPDARMGATCGRVANRIGGASYTIDGVRHALLANEGGNQLHGGPLGFDRRRWTTVRAGPRAVELSLTSADGDQGHPGEVEVRAIFSIERSRDDADGEWSGLRIVYAATTDRATHVNIVSHPYFNLAGDAGPVLAHELWVAADAYLPIDDDGVPTGKVAGVAGTPFDFRRPHPIGERIDADDVQLRRGDGYNHNLALAGAGMRDVATLYDPASGRRLSVATDRAGLQLYTANALPGAGRRSAVCLETQDWPDAANRPHFPSTRLDPGGTYRAETLLRFSRG